jgi:hypothetical protein
MKIARPKTYKWYLGMLPPTRYGGGWDGHESAHPSIFPGGEERTPKYVFFPLIPGDTGSDDDYIAGVLDDLWFLVPNKTATSTKLDVLGPFPNVESMIAAWKIIGLGAP